MTSPAGAARFGKYTLLSKLGMGGMAEVYKAEVTGQPDVALAIKKILPQYAEDKKLMTMMVNEARLTMSLAHPNIVPVLDFGRVEGDYFMAMEYIRGKDLKSLMIRCKSRGIDLPLHMSIFMLIQILQGLHHAHEKRDHYDQPLEIVHRDMSPHNVIVSYWGQVKILDFGIAKTSAVASSTQTGILKGKFSYMSPEQAFGKEIDRRTDIFSSGIVLWELLTLESCYSAETDIKLLQKVRDAAVRNPIDVNPKVPRALADIVMTALEKKPRKRFQTAAEFAYQLEKFQKETFGKVTEADLAVFVRKVFGIDPKELAGLKPPQSLSAENPLSHSMEEAVNQTRSSEVSIDLPAPPRSKARWNVGEMFKEIPKWIWKIPLYGGLAIGTGWFVKSYPPKYFFEKYDHQVVRLATIIHKRAPKPAETPLPSVVQLIPSTAPKALYPLQYAPEATQALEKIAFDEFERVRNRADDLALEPKPMQSQALPQRPGALTLDQSGYRITYRVTDQPRLVLVEQIEKLKP